MNADVSTISDAVRRLAESAEQRLRSHPGPEELVAYHHGRLTAERERGLQGHLAVCHDCSALLLELMAMTDAETVVAESEWRDAWQTMRPRLRDETATADTTQPRSGWWSMLFGSPRLAYALAAVFFLGTCSLGVWTFLLHRTLEEHSLPQFNVVIRDLDPQSFARTEQLAAKAFEVPAEVERIILILNPTEPRVYPDYLGRIFDEAGHVVWSARGLRVTEFGNFTLEISRRFLPRGRYQIEIYGLDGEREILLDRYAVRLVDS